MNHDRLGHDIGDQVLVEVAGRLPTAPPTSATCVPDGRRRVPRPGRGLHRSPQVTELAEWLLATVAEPVQVAGHRLRS